MASFERWLSWFLPEARPAYRKVWAWGGFVVVFVMLGALLPPLLGWPLALVVAVGIVFLMRATASLWRKAYRGNFDEVRAPGVSRGETRRNPRGRSWRAGPDPNQRPEDQDRRRRRDV